MSGKIGLLTLDAHSFNYGGILQEYALQHIIEEQGYICEVLNYKKSTELRTFSPRRKIRYLTLDKLCNKIEQFIQREKENIQVTEIVARRRKRFELFIRNYINLSAQCNHRELPGISLHYKTIVCGSDQIWNPAFNRPSLFLDFVPDSVGRVIYAASIGLDALTKCEKKVYEEYMESLQWISVREIGAKELLEQITKDKSIKLVLDPTLLVNPTHWRQLAGSERLIQDNYVFCYFLEINVQKRKAAKEFASGCGLKLVSLPYLYDKYEALDDDFTEKEIDAGPIEFLNLILYADFVLTDSFHASAISVSFHKDFRVFVREWGRGDMTTRIHTLLGYINREEYLISPSQLKESVKKEKQGWNIENIVKKREESLEWLREALNSSDNRLSDNT